MIKIEKGVATGKVNAPPSKSMVHRALICAGLSGGECEIKNIEYSKDIISTLSCLESLGKKFQRREDSVKFEKPDIESKLNNFSVSESGSTLRFFIPICLTLGKKCDFFGATRLFERPLDIYEKIAKEQGFLFEKCQNSLSVCGKLKSGKYEVSGDVSSQFISGLMFALALLGEKSEIAVTGNFESKPYVYMTAEMQKYFGVNVWIDENVIYIPKNSSYTPKSYTAEGDFSNAAFLDAFNLLGGSVTVGGLNGDSLQGDKIYKNFYEKFKTQKNPDFDIADCPDLAPVLMALGAYFGGCRLTGTRRLAIKESNRGEAMARELKKMGIDTKIYENEITLSGKISPPTETILSHGDHRIVMAMALLLTKTGGVIDGETAVEKSFPTFFEKIKQLGIEAKKCDL